MKRKSAIVVIFTGLIICIGSLLASKVMLPQKNPLLSHQGAIINSEVDLILRRSCFDCHSHETKWPWYSNLPIVSTLIAHDVREAREEMNFSKWGKYSRSKQQHLLKESLEEIMEGEMPMPIYLLMHPEARLSEADLQLLKEFL